MSKIKRDLTEDDFQDCIEIINSVGVQVTSCDNVWHTMFFQTDERSLSLLILNCIDKKLQAETEFYLFSASVSKGGDRTLRLCIGFKENR